MREDVEKSNLCCEFSVHGTVNCATLRYKLIFALFPTAKSNLCCNRVSKSSQLMSQIIPRQTAAFGFIFFQFPLLETFLISRVNMSAMSIWCEEPDIVGLLLVWYFLLFIAVQRPLFHLKQNETQFVKRMLTHKKKHLDDLETLEFWYAYMNEPVIIIAGKGRDVT